MCTSLFYSSSHLSFTSLPVGSSSFLARSNFRLFSFLDFGVFLLLLFASNYESVCVKAELFNHKINGKFVAKHLSRTRLPLCS